MNLPLYSENEGMFLHLVRSLLASSIFPYVKRKVNVLISIPERRFFKDFTVLRELFGMSTNIAGLLLKCLLHRSIFNVIRTEANTYRLINNLMSYNGYLLWLHLIRIIIICPADGGLASWIKLLFEQLSHTHKCLSIGEHFFLLSSISHKITEIT